MGFQILVTPKTHLPSPKQLDELFKERRTIRFFKEDKLDRSLVEEIVNYGIYAPTNNYALRAIVVDDAEMIEKLDRICFQFVSRIYNIFYRSKLVFELLRKITPAIDLKDKVKLEETIKQRSVLHNCGTMVLIVGGKRSHAEGLSPNSSFSGQCAICFIQYDSVCPNQRNRDLPLGRSQDIFESKSNCQKTLEFTQARGYFRCCANGLSCDKF